MARLLHHQAIFQEHVTILADHAFRQVIPSLSWPCIQSAGAMFIPPAPLTLPNVDGHVPGAQVEMFSFDHDLEEFVAIELGARKNLLKN